MNAHADCASQLPKCQVKQKLLRRQKSTSEIENRVDVEEESEYMILGPCRPLIEYVIIKTMPYHHCAFGGSENHSSKDAFGREILGSPRRPCLPSSENKCLFFIISLSSSSWRESYVDP